MSECADAPFLSLLDNDPETAFRDFYNFANRVLNLTPPPPMRGLSLDDKKELIGDIVYHCVKDNFRVLRQFEFTGRPFAAWFYVTAGNKCRDYLRQMGRTVETVSIHSGSGDASIEDFLPNPGPDGEKKVDLGKLLSATKEAIAKLGEQCRLLLQMAADEFTPREMVTVLRLPADQNKKISDDLRECRRKLKKLLDDAGYDISSMVMA